MCWLRWSCAYGKSGKTSEEAGVTNDSGIGRSARSLIVTLYRFAVYFLLSPAVLTIASTGLMPADSYAAIIDGFSCHRFDHVAEVQFQMRGTAPRWHLQ